MRFVWWMFVRVGVFALHDFVPGSVPATALSQAQLTVTAVNRLKTARTSETIELKAKDLAALAEKDLNKLHVRDSSGKEVLSQSVDTDYDDLSQA